MSSYHRSQPNHWEYPDGRPYDYDGFSTSPSSFGAGSSYPMTATNSSQSMSSASSYARSPTSWELSAQQQSYSPIYDAMSSSPSPSQPYPLQQESLTYQYGYPQSYASSEETARREQVPYAQYQPQTPQMQDPPRTQRIGGSGSVSASAGGSRSQSPPRQFVCLEPGCESKGCFTRAADLARHQNTMHYIKKRYSCPRPNCGRKGERGFSRKDHLKEHLRNTHGRDVPKRGERGGS